MKMFRPQFYIKSNEKNAKYQCVICNFIAEKPYICNGPCKKIYCFQCINIIRNNSNACPFRCSSPFELTEGPHVELEFNCPFNSELCKEKISCLSSFYEHNNFCKYLPKDWKQKEENFVKYRCDKGHELFFIDCNDMIKIYGPNYYEKIINETCSSCSQKGICRTVCPKCSTLQKKVLFCTNCRKPPCIKKTCLYEHPLKKIQCHSKALVCDFCGIHVHLLGEKVFRDNACDFDICQVCYVNLPEDHELVPFKMSKDQIKHLYKKKPPMYSIEDQLQYIEDTYGFPFNLLAPAPAPVPPISEVSDMPDILNHEGNHEGEVIGDNEVVLNVGNNANVPEVGYYQFQAEQLQDQQQLQENDV